AQPDRRVPARQHTLRDNALATSLAGPPHDATASGPTSAGIAPARPPGRSSHGSATLGPRPPVHGPVPQRRPKDCPAVSPARSLAVGRKQLECLRVLLGGVLFSTLVFVRPVFRRRFMWPYRVVPLWQHFSWFQMNGRLFFLRDLTSGGITATIQTSTTSEASFRSRLLNPLEHDRITLQRFSRPILTDQAEHPMIDQIPLRSSRRGMGYSNDDLKFVRQRLQSRFPQPVPSSVRSASIRLDQPTLGL